MKNFIRKFHNTEICFLSMHFNEFHGLKEIDENLITHSAKKFIDFKSDPYKNMYGDEVMRMIEDSFNYKFNESISNDIKFIKVKESNQNPSFVKKRKKIYNDYDGEIEIERYLDASDMFYFKKNKVKTNKPVKNIYVNFSMPVEYRRQYYNNYAANVFSILESLSKKYFLNVFVLGIGYMDNVKKIYLTEIQLTNDLRDYNRKLYSPLSYKTFQESFIFRANGENTFLNYGKYLYDPTEAFSTAVTDFNMYANLPTYVTEFDIIKQCLPSISPNDLIINYMNAEKILNELSK